MTVTMIWGEQGLLGGGYEFERPMSAWVDSALVTWTERVQVVRSLVLAERESRQLEQRLAKAEAALQVLTPPPVGADGRIGTKRPCRRRYPRCWSGMM